MVEDYGKNVRSPPRELDGSRGRLKGLPDLSVITSALTAVKTATEIASFFRQSDFSLQKAKTKDMIADLLNALADAKISIAEARTLIEEKEREINELRAALELSKKLVRHRDAYFETDSNGNPIGDPYCIRCWEADHRAIHLVTSGAGWRSCPECRRDYRAHSVSLA